VAVRILELVAEMTGYPQDMLDLDLDMEADLGIDTVKQAEMFAAIREEWDIPRDEDLQLRDFPTLAHSIQFVYDRRPDLQDARVSTDQETVEAGPGPVEESTAPVSAPVAASDDPVGQRILELVAELTGYPEDMLDLDLDMEADLGIDTVKQAEMFAAIREEWGIPRDDNLQLRDFPTLAHSIQFVYDRRPDLSSPGAIAPPHEGSGVVSALAPTSMGPEVELHREGVPRRVPVALLRPSLDLCKTTPVGALEGRRIVVMPDEGGIGLALARSVDRLGGEVLLVEGAPDSDGLRQQLELWLADGRIDGVYWLPALDSVGDISDLAAEGWAQALEQRVKLMHAAMQILYDSFDREGTFLVTGTRMGGRHGYDSQGALSPLGGAVCGFSKTLKRERPQATVKVVDFAADVSSAKAAAVLIDETLKDPGVVEVGYADDLRWTVGLAERPLGPEDAEIELAAEPVFVVTGAAGSIVSAIVSDLARRWPGHFYLLDLTPEPTPDDPDLQLFRSDREALKRQLFERLKGSGEKATPANVEKRLAACERSQAALTALAAVAEAGGEGYYRSVDLLDAQAVAEVVGEIRARHGRIDVLIHAAGVEISHMLPEKSRQEFDLIFDVKAHGWFHLLKSAADMPIGSTVVFTSIAGRFGNAGQTDYSAANDLLCELTSNLLTKRPETRGIAIDWSAWAEIGMASRGSIPQMMEQAGIDMVPPAIGIPIVAREIAHSRGGEIVVAGSLGGLLEEWDETGGLDSGALEPRLEGPMVQSVLGFGLHGGLAVEVELDPTLQPFLFDHRIEGTAVLPAVMGIEAFAEVSGAAFPEWNLIAVEDVEFRSPFKFYRDEPRKVRVQAVFRGDGDELLSECRLIGRRSLAKGERVEETLHFTGRVRIARQPRAAESLAELPAAPEQVLGPDVIYDLYFHGPAYQVLDEAWRNGDRVVGRLQERLPIHHRPEDQKTLSGPRLAELCFQTAGLIEFADSNRVGLPRRVAHIGLFDSSGERAGARAVVEREDSGDFTAIVVDEAGDVLLEMNGYATIESPMTIETEPLAALRRALAARTAGANS